MAKKPDPDHFVQGMVKAGFDAAQIEEFASVGRETIEYHQKAAKDMPRRQKKRLSLSRRNMKALKDAFREGRHHYVNDYGASIRSLGSSLQTARTEELDESMASLSTVTPDQQSSHSVSETVHHDSTLSFTESVAESRISPEDQLKFSGFSWVGNVDNVPSASTVSLDAEDSVFVRLDFGLRLADSRDEQIEYPSDGDDAHVGIVRRLLAILKRRVVYLLYIITF
ncbi:hypothetical protein J8273_7582 [Carpediemonas membranifera]|uniref:Uncharacterized protein n=1 Tax=Carpediemonas membranifera TaxID=201153 RepID=A0A8J6BVF0_9EUKA|nr:hypothetical protein J8273_7582 [Carpediemonas membranifera]|eukprot:KAG9391341.1 hypothetical protein J8273_7582 [Carpediemonas membranifera]